MADWIRTIALGGAIAAHGCVLEQIEPSEDDGVDDGGQYDDDEDTGDDAPADESASYTTVVDTDGGDDTPAERLPVECVAPIHDGCDRLRERDEACENEGTDVGYGTACEELVANLFPPTAECCSAVVEFMTCTAALSCDDAGCTFDPERRCSPD